jgi:hypothetical protein
VRTHALRRVRTRRILAALVSVALTATVLTACVPDPHADGTRIETTSDVALEASYPEDGSVFEAAREAVDNVATSANLMLRPVELTTTDTIPSGGITLQATLPADLPAGAVVRFAYVDEETATWAPVPTEVSGTTVSTTTDHLSMWTVVVSFTDATWSTATVDWDAAGAHWTDVGAQVGESWAAWSSMGPGSWVYRNAGLMLGLQADAPQCDGDIHQEPGLEWVDQAVISQLTGIPIENQSVLSCVGVDPEDPTRLQIKAAANRGFGFRVEFASVIDPEVQWSYLENLATADTAALFDLLSDGALNASATEPVALFQNLLVGTTEMSFSVTEASVRAAQTTGEHLVSFQRPDELQMAVSVLVNLLVSALEGEVGGEIALAGVVLGVRDCMGANLPGEWGNAAAASAWAFGCLQSIVDEDFFTSVDTLTTQAAANKDASFSPNITAIFGTEDNRKLFGKVLHALKWIDVVALMLTMTDYWGERTDNPWWVDVVAKGPDWSGYNGTWCNIYGECALAIESPSVVISAPTAFSTTKTFAGGYSLAGSGALVGNSPGCEEIGLTGRSDGAIALVACPAGTAYTGAGIPNCGCGLETIDEIRSHYIGEDHIYVLVGGTGIPSVEPFSRG